AAGLFGEVGGDVGTDGGEVDDEGAGPGGLEDPALAGEDLDDVGGVGDHERDDVGVGDGLGDARRSTSPGLDQRSGLVRGAVVADDPVSGVVQVDGHGAAHDAQSDEGDA